MKSIGIFEIISHDQHIYSLCSIALSAGYQVTVFTTEKKFLGLKEYFGSNYSKFKWVLKPQGELPSRYLARVIKYCSKYIDVLIVNSIYFGIKDSLSYLRFNPRCKKILGVYNLNKWLNNRFSFKNSLLANYQRLIAGKIISNFNAINVEYEPLLDYACNASYTGKIYAFAPVFSEASSCASGEYLRVLVPGFIEESRRDYHLVLDIFAKVLSENNKKIELCLLGGPVRDYGKQIIDRCNILKDKGHKIRYFTKPVSFQTFTEEIKNSDIVLSPLCRRVIDGYGIEETYGTTKGSGIIFDAVRFGKPLILPGYFKLAEYLRRSTLQYNDREELEEIIIGLINDKYKFNNLKNAALLVAEEFSLDKQKNRFGEMITKLINQG